MQMQAGTFWRIRKSGNGISRIWPRRRCRAARWLPSSSDPAAKRARYIAPLRKRIVGADLNRAAGGADEVAEDGDVGAVDTDATCIDRQAELFGLFEIDTCVVQFGKAETLRGQNAIEARRIDGTGRTMTAPRTTSYLVELLPVAFLPGPHFANLRFVPSTLDLSLPTTCTLPR